MCVACLEYSKDKLNINEFRAALREMTEEDAEHYKAVKQILADYDGQPDEIKKRLAELNGA